MVKETLDEYERLINEAAESGADIVAFPEGSLNYVGIATRSLLIKHAVELNDSDLRNSTDFNGEHCDYQKMSPVANFSFTFFLPLLSRPHFFLSKNNEEENVTRKQQ